VWRSILAGVLTIASQSSRAAQPVLVPGALPADCRSALRIGLVSCSQPALNDLTDSATPGHVVPPPVDLMPIIDFSRPRSVSEAQVNEYLAQFGKPPREAVRALLDPTDANIAAWIRKQRQVLSIASYVATRMTEMQMQLDTDSSVGSPLPPSGLSAMIQMRATLYLNASDAPSRQAVRALQQLVARHPSVDGRLAQVGPPADPHLSSWLATLDTVLPVSILAPDAIDSMPFPSLLIEDLRYGQSRLLRTEAITAQRIEDQIIALRAGAERLNRQSESARPVP
jgi:hypothetical protein